MEASAQDTAATLAGCLTLSKSVKRRDISLKYANRTASSGSIYTTRGININMYFILHELFSTNKVDKT